jgi:protein subunit release factor A
MANTDKSKNQEVMSENQPIHLTEGEMETLKEVMETYNQCSGAFGQVEVQKMNLAQQGKSLDDQRMAVEEEWKANQSKEARFSSKLTTKYGPGSINPETGEYTPQPEQAQPPAQAMA